MVTATRRSRCLRVGAPQTLLSPISESPAVSPNNALQKTGSNRLSQDFNEEIVSEQTLPPSRTYAEATKNTPSGGSSTASTRSSTVGHLATPTVDSISGTPSTQRLHDGTDGSHGSQNQSPSNIRMSQHKTTRKHRTNWTKEEKKELWFCYCLAKVQKLKVVRGTYDIWRERNGDDYRPTMDALGLNSQRGSIKLQLSEEEKIAIQDNAEAHVRLEPQEEEDRQKDDTTRVDDIDPPRISPTECATPPPTHQEDPTEDTEYSKLVDQLYADITVVYHKYQALPLQERLKLRKFDRSGDGYVTLKAAKEAVQRIRGDIEGPLSVDQYNTLLYAVALTLAGPVVDKPKKEHQPRTNVEDKNVRRLRKIVNKLTAVARGKSRVSKRIERLLRKRGSAEALEDYRMQLAAAVQRKKSETKRKERFVNNTNFRTDPKKFYSDLRFQEQEAVQDPPPVEKVEEYWTKLWSEKSFNKDAPWVRAEEKRMEDVEEGKWEELTYDDLKTAIRRLANWKAAGLDRVQNFWIKHISPLHDDLLNICNEAIEDPSTVPYWMTGGRTTLLYKNGDTTEAKNYRPISCLPTLYKLITLIITDRLYTHLTDNEILPFAQKGVRRKSRGCKDQLMIDAAIMADARRMQKDVSFMWIDYKKAYDSVPHAWIKRMLSLYKVHETIIRFITYLMPTWRTKLFLPTKHGTVETDDIFFRRGIFQGDSLSPLLFCLALAPISAMLVRAKLGYRIKKK